MKIKVKYIAQESHGIKWTQFKREIGVPPKAIAHGVSKFDVDCALCKLGVKHT